MPHLRPPAFSHGFISFLWGVGLGAFVWLGLLSIGTRQATALLFGLIAAGLIFFFVRLYGSDEFKRP